MKRLTHRYHDGQAWVSLNLVSKAMENECVGLPITKLAEYEDLEESGRLVRLPCKLGDTVYVIEADEDNSDHFYCPMKISEYEFDVSLLSFWGKSVFYTKEDAEAALEKMENITTEVSVSRWVNGNREMKLKYLKSVCDVLNVSADWLIGRDDG